LAVGPPSGRKVVIAKELTKIYEEVVSGALEEVLDFFKENPDKVKGEFVVIVDSVRSKTLAVSADALHQTSNGIEGE